MKADYINGFIRATTEVMGMAAQISLATGKPFVQQDPFPAKHVMIVVGITGEIKGQAILSLEDDLAKKIASNMMMGMPVDELNEMSKSALQEMGNMIMGNAATLLYNNGITIDITPPSLVIGESMQISGGKMKTISVPLTAPEGEILLNISAQE